MKEEQWKVRKILIFHCFFQNETNVNLAERIFYGIKEHTRYENWRFVVVENKKNKKLSKMVTYSAILITSCLILSVVSAPVTIFADEVQKKI